MANDGVILFLDGAPTIDDYASAIAGLRELLSAIGADVASSVQIEWRIDTLEASSALTGLRGTSEDMAAVARVSSAFVEVGKSVRTGSLDSAFTTPVAKITELLGTRIPSVRFENDEDDVTIAAAPDVLADIIPLRIDSRDLTPQRGVVEGRIETVSRRGGLRFILFDLNFDKAVTCYLAPGMEDLMLNAWGRLALVEGIVKRDPLTGRPTTVRQVTNIELIEEGLPGDWRQAMGAQQDPSGRSEHRIRRIRDAQ